MDPPDSHSPPANRARPGLRWMLPALLSLVALAVAVADWRAADRFDRQRRELLAVLEDPALAGLPASVEERLDRSADPAWRSMLLARTLVATELDLDSTPALDRSPEARTQRLALAREAAATALARRPTSWQGALFLGSATYLERSVTEDPRLFTAYRDWEAPLELARTLAPSKPEPGRFLAVAYLELWPAVAEAKRQVARELVAEAFQDARLFGRLVEPWLALAEDRQRAFAPIPDDPRAWLQVQQVLGRQGDWAGVVEARQRLAAARQTKRQELLEQGEVLAQRGDGAGARRSLLLAATLGEPGTAGVPTLLQALDRLPPGPAGTLEPRFRAWLDWALELCHRERCPLPPEALDRVAGLAGSLEEPVAAHAALVGGRLADGERRERRSHQTWRPEWAPYHVERARQLRARGETTTALEALEEVAPSARDAAYWLARQDLEAALELPLEDRRERRQRAALALAPTRGPTWSADGWNAADDGQVRDVLIFPEDLPAAAAMLEITLAVVPEDGAVVEAHLDGRAVLLEPVAPGGILRLPAPGPGLHQLRLESVAGGRVLAGEVRRGTAEVESEPQAAPSSTTAVNALAG